eukprot:jgi/Chlat1/9235/Chrsp99S08485
MGLRGDVFTDDFLDGDVALQDMLNYIERGLFSASVKLRHGSAAMTLESWVGLLDLASLWDEQDGRTDDLSSNPLSAVLRGVAGLNSTSSITTAANINNNHNNHNNNSGLVLPSISASPSTVINMPSLPLLETRNHQQVHIVPAPFSTQVTLKQETVQYLPERSHNQLFENWPVAKSEQTATSNIDSVQTPTAGSSKTKRGKKRALSTLQPLKRRTRMNERFEKLRHLVPNGSKQSKAAVLGAVIEYVRQLQKLSATLDKRDVAEPNSPCSGESSDTPSDSVSRPNSDGECGHERMRRTDSMVSFTEDILPTGEEVHIRDKGDKVLIGIHCKNRRGLSHDILQVMHDLHLQVTQGELSHEDMQKALDAVVKFDAMHAKSDAKESKASSPKHATTCANTATAMAQTQSICATLSGNTTACA